ncbi:hypothetical protein [Nocardia abscessus]|uniref:hypothetical protein n=1 Tax=Nocardia abscessus TaxID=120957 RepID=UPI0024580DFB|nr:hypothetical protein [Nocardia abscessus]
MVELDSEQHCVRASPALRLGCAHRKARLVTGATSAGLQRLPPPRQWHRAAEACESVLGLRRSGFARVGSLQGERDPPKFLNIAEKAEFWPPVMSWPPYASTNDRYSEADIRLKSV